MLNRLLGQGFTDFFSPKERALNHLSTIEPDNENSPDDISRSPWHSDENEPSEKFREEAWREPASTSGGGDFRQNNQALSESSQTGVNVVLVDTVAFPWRERANRESNLYDEVLEFHHARDLPVIAQSLRDRYPDAHFDITLATHGNSGRPAGYKLLQRDGKIEYVKYGALEEALYSAHISENSVRIFYGGCNAATGYYNANLSSIARRYARVTYGASSMNRMGDFEPSTDMLRLYEHDRHYGLLADIKRPYPDEIRAHAHSVPLDRSNYRDRLSEIASLRKTQPDVFEERIREFVSSYR